MMYGAFVADCDRTVAVGDQHRGTVLAEPEHRNVPQQTIAALGHLRVTLEERFNWVVHVSDDRDVVSCGLSRGQRVGTAAKVRVDIQIVQVDATSHVHAGVLAGGLIEVIHLGRSNQQVCCGLVFSFS